MDGMFVVASEDGMIDTIKGQTRDAFWQSLLLTATTAAAAAANDDDDDGHDTDANAIPGSTICLRSAHGKFLCVEPMGTVLADRFVNSTWETFDVLPHPTMGGVSLRSFHGNFLGLDATHGLTISRDPVAWDSDSITMLMCKKGAKDAAVPIHMKIMRKYQTQAFVARQIQMYQTLQHARLTLEEAIQTLLQLNGEPRDSIAISDSHVLRHMLFLANHVRQNGHPDWLQLVTFL